MSQELLAAALTAHANASCKALKRLVLGLIGLRPRNLWP